MLIRKIIREELSDKSAEAAMTTKSRHEARREDGMAEARRWIWAVTYFKEHPALAIEWRPSSKRPGKQYGHVVEPRPTRVDRVIEVVHSEVGVLLTPADVAEAARSMTPPMRVRPGAHGDVVTF